MKGSPGGPGIVAVSELMTVDEKIWVKEQNKLYALRCLAKSA